MIREDPEYVAALAALASAVQAECLAETLAREARFRADAAERAWQRAPEGADQLERERLEAESEVAKVADRHSSARYRTAVDARRRLEKICAM